MDPISRSDLFCMIMTITYSYYTGKGFYERGKNEQLIALPSKLYKTVDNKKKSMQTHKKVKNKITFYAS